MMWRVTVEQEPFGRNERLLIFQPNANGTVTMLEGALTARVIEENVRYEGTGIQFPQGVCQAIADTLKPDETDSPRVEALLREQLDFERGRVDWALERLVPVLHLNVEGQKP
jgi:hypothetical protein